MDKDVAHQYQGRVVESVSGIDVYAFGDQLLAGFQVTSSASIAEKSEVLAVVQRVVVFESARRYLLLLCIESGL